MKYPTESQAIIKYGSLIRDLAARGHNWRFYDENCCFIRQSHISSLPFWHVNKQITGSGGKPRSSYKSRSSHPWFLL